MAALKRARPSAMQQAEPKADPPRADEVVQSEISSAPSVQAHRVKRGETLGHIASRYDTREAVLRALNGIPSDESIREGQILFVPSQGKATTTHSPANGASWRRYVRPPKERGFVELSTPAARFAGLVVDKEGRLRPPAVRAINGMLGAGGKHPPLPERLIRLLAKVSDTFGGRALHVVSGHRTSSYYQDSRHRSSAAVDFTVADVPNAVLCEYLRELDNVGVGYYPNSTFVHLDVRLQSAYWVDYAGPGEPPRSTPNAPRSAPSSKKWLLAELDALGDHAKKSLERASTESSRDLPTTTLPAIEPQADDEHPSSVDESMGSSRGS